MEKEDYAAAVAILEKHLREEPSDSVAHFQLGYALISLGRAADARRAYARAAELDPGLAQAHLNLGILLLEEEPAAAVAPLARAAELLPEDSRAHFLLGLARERSGDLAEAAAAYRAAAALDPQSFDICFALARTLLAADEARDAAAAFRRALELRLDSAPAQLGLAESLIALDEFEPAAAALRRYLDANPGDAASQLQLASVYADLRRDDAALASLADAQKAGAETRAVETLRSEILLRRGRLDDAVQALERAVAASPANAALLARLGRLRLEQRNFPAAAETLLAALKLDPGLTDAWRDLTSTYYLAENYRAALAALDRLAERVPEEADSAGSWFLRATCYDKLGRKTEALEAYERFLVFDAGRSDRRSFQARERIRILSRELKRR